MLIKDNHIAVAGGIRPAMERARAATGHLVKIELEVDALAQLEEALRLGVDAVLLDNMTPDQLREAVAMVRGRAITEASGRITPETVASVAASGVDLISIGWLTHSVTALDIGLDYRLPRQWCDRRWRFVLRSRGRKALPNAVGLDSNRPVRVSFYPRALRQCHPCCANPMPALSNQPR